MLIGSELLTYRTEVLFLFVYRILFESNGRAHPQPGFVFPVLSPRSSVLTGCRVEQGLGGSYSVN
jgi:hypothetical protein